MSKNLSSKFNASTKCTTLCINIFKTHTYAYLIFYPIAFASCSCNFIRIFSFSPPSLSVSLWFTLGIEIQCSYKVRTWIYVKVTWNLLFLDQIVCLLIIPGKLVFKRGTCLRQSWRFKSADTSATRSS